MRVGILCLTEHHQPSFGQHYGGNVITTIKLSKTYQPKQESRERLAEHYRIDTEGLEPYAEAIRSILYTEINAKLKRRGYSLTFEEAFVGICYVLHATNGRFREFATEHELFPKHEHLKTLTAREFLDGLSVKEGHVGLSVNEITGIVSAASLDLVTRPYVLPVLFEVCGMGGDRGFLVHGERRKTINASTLSSLVVAACGVKTMKHGSYSNTSAVGSTDSIEGFGVNTELENAQAIGTHLDRVGYVFTDAHVVKTIHDASHLEPRHETVNHVIGPMTLPVSSRTLVNKVMGVNEKVHPVTAARAFAELNLLGIQRYGSVAVVAGLSKECADPAGALDERDPSFYDDAVLDELSPYASVVSFVQNGSYAGAYILTPDHFGITVTEEEILVPNDRLEIHNANARALCGVHPGLTKYLAMNAALCLYVATCAQTDKNLPRTGPDPALLRTCYETCLETIMSQNAIKLCDAYREITTAEKAYAQQCKQIPPTA